MSANEMVVVNEDVYYQLIDMNLVDCNDCLPNGVKLVIAEDKGFSLDECDVKGYELDQFLSDSGLI